MTAAQRYPILSPVEIRKLVRRYQRTRDPVAADRLMRSHYRLVAKIARQYAWSRQDVRDLIQAGCIGFLLALDRYDLKREVLLSTYAVHWIRAYISRLVLDGWRLVRVGTTAHQRNLFSLARKDKAAISEPDQAILRHMKVRELSLDAPIVDSEGSASGTRLDRLRAAEEARPDVLVEEREASDCMQAEVADFAAGLVARERVIFAARWQQPDPETLENLGRRLGVTRERVRQIERAILDRLALRLRSRLGGVEELAPALAVAA